MSNSISLFESSANVPAHIAARFGDVEVNNDLSANVGSGGYPVISYKGKVWHVVRGDERTLITNDEGEPRASLEVVILKANPSISKIYYPNGYEEGSKEKPLCYSTDGHAPASDAAEPQANKCAICPHNAWGSRVTENGAKGKACSDSRRLAVAPIGDLENPMLLRIPAATLKELTAYADLLNRRKAPYKAVVTKIGFDHTVAHQKLTFKALRWLTGEEADVVADVLEREIVRNIVGMEADLELEGTPPARLMDQTEEKPKPKPAKAKPVKYAATEDEVDTAFEPVEEPAPKVAAKPAKSKVATVVDDADASLDDILASLGMDDD